MEWLRSSLKMLKIDNLSKSYGNFQALKNISLQTKEGEIFGILGPNGAGKSTFIKILTCFHQASSGKVEIDGIDIKKQAKIKQRIGWVPQEESFYQKLTVQENLNYFGSLYNLEKKAKEERTTQLLELLKIKDKKNARAEELSGGMKRRLSIAIALIHSPKLVLLDEPTAGVDTVSRMALWDVIREIKKQNVTVLLCTHHLDEADILCDRIAILQAGEILMIDSPKQLKNKYGKTLDEAFVNIVTR